MYFYTLCLIVISRHFLGTSPLSIHIVISFFFGSRRCSLFEVKSLNSFCIFPCAVGEGWASPFVILIPLQVLHIVTLFLCCFGGWLYGCYFSYTLELEATQNDDTVTGSSPVPFQAHFKILFVLSQINDVVDRFSLTIITLMHVITPCFFSSFSLFLSFFFVF